MGGDLLPTDRYANLSDFAAELARNFKIASFFLELNLIIELNKNTELMGLVLL